MKNGKANLNIKISLKDQIKLTELESKFTGKNLCSVDKQKINQKETTVNSSNILIYKHQSSSSKPKSEYPNSNININKQHLTDRKITSNLKFNSGKVNNLSLRKEILSETEKSGLDNHSPLHRINLIKLKSQNSSKDRNKAIIQNHEHTHTKSDVSELNNNRKSDKLDIILNPFKVQPPIYKGVTSTQKNIGLIYSDLARQLKQGKNSNKMIQSKNKVNQSTNFLEKESILNYTKEKEFNQSVEPIFVNRSKVSRTHMNTTFGFNKTTKDNSIGSIKMSFNNFKTKNLNLGSDIEGPEELHSFYVSLIQQNKNLALKFDNVKNLETHFVETEY